MLKNDFQINWFDHDGSRIIELLTVTIYHIR